MRKLALALFLAFSACPAAAETHLPSELVGYMPSPQPLVSARFSFVMWAVYDATLYTPAGQKQVAPPFALSLTYLMDLSGREIANHSIKEMRRENPIREITLAQWHSQLQAIIPDVAEGDTLTGVVGENLSTHFYKNGSKIGVISDPAFTTAFFNIWLGRNSTDQVLRNKLMTISETGELPCVQNFCN